jgi:hypothetical protein
MVMLAMLAVLLAAIVWLASGDALRTPAPGSVTKATPTYDTDVPSRKTPGGNRP